MHVSCTHMIGIVPSNFNLFCEDKVATFVMVAFLEKSLLELYWFAQEFTISLELFD